MMGDRTTDNLSMSDNSLDSAVLMLVFNRPDVTERVFQMVRRARPNRLYVSADGPRESVAGDLVKSNETRKIFDRVDWDCEVKTNFSDKNKGCRQAVAEGIDWFFESEEEGIILEDDCLPNESFFRFSAEMLGRYRADERIMHINGNNFGTSEFIESPFSYHFCSYAQVWGWATWRRAWLQYQKDLELWPAIQNGNWLRNIGWSSREFKIQNEKYNLMCGEDAIDTWDYQWQFTLFVNNGLAISPKQNLVSNIGFGADATHTRGEGSGRSEIPTQEMSFPLIHPDFVRADYQLDKLYRRMMIRPLQETILEKVRRLFRRSTGI
ncbi:MAG: hypothetical protein ACWGOV_05430 [Acidiferrobacterales bacterium]